MFSLTPLIAIVGCGSLAAVFFWLIYSKKPFLFRTRFFLAILGLNVATILPADFKHSIVEPLQAGNFSFTFLSVYSGFMALILAVLIFQIFKIKSYSVFGVTKIDFNNAIKHAIAKAELETTPIPNRIKSVVRLRVEPGKEQIQYNKNVWAKMTEFRVSKAKDDVIIDGLVKNIRQYFNENDCKLTKKATFQPLYWAYFSPLSQSPS